MATMGEIVINHNFAFKQFYSILLISFLFYASVSDLFSNLKPTKNIKKYGVLQHKMKKVA